MDLNRAFSFVFEDEDWIPIILLLGLLLLIPIVGSLAMTGLTLVVADRVLRGEARPLPSSRDFGLVLKQGLYGFGISLYYSLPILLISLVLLCCMLAVGFSDSETLTLIVTGLVVCLSLPLILIGMVLYLMTFAAFGRYIRTGSFSAALRLGPVFASLRSNLSAWLVLLLLSLLCSFIASLGGLALGIGIILTTPYAAAVLGHFLGQHLRSMPAISDGPAAVPPAEPPPAAVPPAEPPPAV